MLPTESDVTVEITKDLLVWRALNDPGKPWCINGPGDDGLNVSLYLDILHDIQGVEIANESGIVAGYGLVPYREER